MIRNGVRVSTRKDPTTTRMLPRAMTATMATGKPIDRFIVMPSCAVMRMASAGTEEITVGTEGGGMVDGFPGNL